MNTTPRYSYNEFRSYIKGRGYSSIDISALWMAYKNNKITNKDLDDVRVLKAYLGSKEPHARIKTKISPKPIPKKESLVLLSNLLPYLGTKYAPREILWNMMVFLDPADILSLCRTDKYFASTVCGDKFWEHYIKSNYGAAILGSHNSWRDLMIDLLKSYDGVISVRNTRTGDSFGKVIEPLVSDYTGNFKKMVSDNTGSVYYYIDDNFKVYYIDTSPRAYPVTSVPILVDKKIIEAHTYTNYQEGFYLVFMIEVDGTIYYTLKQERKPTHENHFEILPDIKANKIYDNYIIQPDRSVIRYNIESTIRDSAYYNSEFIPNDLTLVMKAIKTPVPFTFISDYHYQTHTWTIALDDDGRVWAKGDNFGHQLGLGNRRIYAKFNLVKLTTRIKKVVSSITRTVLLGTDDSVWIMGHLPNEIISRPKKMELIYKRTVKGVVKSQVLHVVDIAISWYRIYLIDDRNKIYAIEKTNKIIKVSINIPASYKKYQISFIGPVKKEYDLKGLYIKKRS